MKGKDKSGRREAAQTRSGNDSSGAAEDGGGGRQWQRTTMTATADYDSGGRRRRRTTTARKIGRWNTRGKEESGQQTTMALDKRLISPPGRECEKIKKSSLRKKTFFSDTVPRKQPMCPFNFISQIFGGGKGGVAHSTPTDQKPIDSPICVHSSAMKATAAAAAAWWQHGGGGGSGSKAAARRQRHDGGGGGGSCRNPWGSLLQEIPITKHWRFPSSGRLP
jgi:hypothetical protein